MWKIPMRPATQCGWVTAAVAVVVLVLCSAAPRVDAELSPEIKAALTNSKYVYIASTRKNGSLSKPAEIWFLYRDGAVYVGTPPTSWRARRIKANRTQAKIWVGKADGPSFMATGAIVNDPAAQQAMLEAYAKKYPDGWSRFEEKFRSGFKDGTRVLIKYTPKE
ncbi:MAG TPA: hypothetical protein VMW56_12015 [Candidatus Margulisiibacteriota bacterium]|nr:hypothetical protein [Candidatus Margulisiibacteriota bacterium]